MVIKRKALYNPTKIGSSFIGVYIGSGFNERKLTHNFIRGEGIVFIKDTPLIKKSMFKKDVNYKIVFNKKITKNKKQFNDYIIFKNFKDEQGIMI